MLALVLRSRKLRIIDRGRNNGIIVRLSPRLNVSISLGARIRNRTTHRILMSRLINRRACTCVRIRIIKNCFIILIINRRNYRKNIFILFILFKVGFRTIFIYSTYHKCYIIYH